MKSVLLAALYVSNSFFSKLRSLLKPCFIWKSSLDVAPATNEVRIPVQPEK